MKKRYQREEKKHETLLGLTVLRTRDIKIRISLKRIVRVLARNLLFKRYRISSNSISRCVCKVLLRLLARKHLNAARRLINCGTRYCYSRIDNTSSDSENPLTRILDECTFRLNPLTSQCLSVRGLAPIYEDRQRKDDRYE